MVGPPKHIPRRGMCGKSFPTPAHPPYKLLMEGGPTPDPRSDPIIIAPLGNKLVSDVLEPSEVARGGGTTYTLMKTDCVSCKCVLVN
jgi:hypothetical protein